MEKTYELGMMGLGVMGHNLVLNMSDHGFAVAGYDINPTLVETFNQHRGNRDLQAFEHLKTFVNSLKTPRVVMMMVPAGVVDAAIESLLPHLDKNDILMDGGNSHFSDTDRRAKAFANQGIRFLGVGVSGGEAGARNGPSIMPGGPKAAYERIQPVFNAIAAKVDAQPCVAYLGPGSAGHYVKMVHNGIEYGLMQLIAESYHLMKIGLGLSNTAMAAQYAQWNQRGLNSFLLEITADIFRQQDEQTGQPLLDQILDVARQKGTGLWTSEDAMKLNIPVPTIDIAVAIRDLSVFKKDREALSKVLSGPPQAPAHPAEMVLRQLENALYASMVLVYAQGLSLLQAASQAYQYELDLATVARIWRGGCIIRSALLNPIADAYQESPTLSTLLLNRHFSQELSLHQGDLRKIAIQAAEWGIPAPAFANSLTYYDAYRHSNLPANLIQAQRDFFGAHTYERVDRAGTFHTEWQSRNQEAVYVHS